MKKHSYRLLLLTLIGIIFYSCQGEDDFVKKESSSIEQQVPESVMTLGKKLENPYSVANMQRAMDTILKEVKKSENVAAKSLQKSAEQVVIEETDLYVRFLPKDSLELNILETDSTLVLFNYPLDYEIEQDGEHYHDPEIPEDQISWRYTVVKPDYQFPEEIEHEILSDLFIPENHPSYTIEEGEKSNTFNKKVTLDNLETVSF